MIQAVSMAQNQLLWSMLDASYLSFVQYHLDYDNSLLYGTSMKISINYNVHKILYLALLLVSRTACQHIHD